MSRFYVDVDIEIQAENEEIDEIVEHIIGVIEAIPVVQAASLISQEVE